VRNYYGSAARRVAVKADRPWYYQAIVAFLCVGLGFGLSCFMRGGAAYEAVGSQLVEMQHQNKMLEFKLVEARRNLQIELATNKSLFNGLAKVQDENLKVKEDLLFYKEMMKK
jgi:hypothetical protein